MSYSNFCLCNCHIDLGPLGHSYPTPFPSVDSSCLPAFITVAYFDSGTSCSFNRYLISLQISCSGHQLLSLSLVLFLVLILPHKQLLHSKYWFRKERNKLKFLPKSSNLKVDIEQCPRKVGKMPPPPENYPDLQREMCLYLEDGSASVQSCLWLNTHYILYLY